MGMSAGMITIPVLPEMLESVEEDADKFNMEQVENYISGLFVTYQSLGEAIGPMVSSYIAEYYSFTISQEFFAIVLLLFAISYFVMCGNFSMFGKDQPHQSSKMDNNMEELSLIDNELHRDSQKEDVLAQSLK